MSLIIANDYIMISSVIFWRSVNNKVTTYLPNKHFKKDTKIEQYTDVHDSLTCRHLLFLLVVRRVQFTGWLKLNFKYKDVNKNIYLNLKFEINENCERIEINNNNIR